MAHIFDVAEYILRRTGAISTWKLQKLVYYAQAWHAVWEDEPLFEARIEAWANGPVSPLLYEQHRGQFTIDRLPNGSAGKLTEAEKSSIDAVVDHYGRYNGQQLSDLTHAEAPWVNARAGLRLDERGNREISLESMVEYYTSLT